MKLTAGRVFYGYQVLKHIADEDRPIPLKGKYRVGRLLKLLEPEFVAVATRHDELVVTYDHRETIAGPKTKDDPLGQKQVPGPHSVPADKLDDFKAKWKSIADEEIEVAVQPIPFEHLETPAAVISANEFIVLGDLVAEPAIG